MARLRTVGHGLHARLQSSVVPAGRIHFGCQSGPTGLSSRSPSFSNRAFTHRRALPIKNAHRTGETPGESRYFRRVPIRLLSTEAHVTDTTRGTRYVTFGLAADWPSGMALHSRLAMGTGCICHRFATGKVDEFRVKSRRNFVVRARQRIETQNRRLIQCPLSTLWRVKWFDLFRTE